MRIAERKKTMSKLWCGYDGAGGPVFCSTWTSEDGLVASGTRCSAVVVYEA